MYILLRLAYFIFNRMSFMSLRKTGMTLGSLFYFFNKKRRKIAEKNCEIIGVKDVKAVAKSSFRHSFATYIESFYSHRIDQKFLDSIEIVNPENIPPSDSGVFFLVSGHIGCWELIPPVASAIVNRKGALIARRIKNKNVDDYLMKQRSGENVIYLHHRNIAEKIPQLLEEGVVVGALLDHSSTVRDSMFVPMFDVNTTFIKGIPMISARRDVPIMPTFLVRTETGFRMIFYPLIHPDKNLKPKERIQDIALRINKIYEDVIRQYPDQWYLIHKRFKKVMDENGNLNEDFYA
ncbi:MAG: lysophospholipid acyltransferase family protein [Deferribacterales bacterium]